MENDIREFSSFDKNIIKNFFRDYIEDSRNSIEKKSQEMQSLISSIK